MDNKLVVYPILGILNNSTKYRVDVLIEEGVFLSLKSAEERAKDLRAHEISDDYFYEVGDPTELLP